MMQDLRAKTKWIMLVVAIAFVGLMVFEWGMDISGRSVATQTGEIGRVNGQAVAYQTYATVHQQLSDLARTQSGGRLSREQARAVEDQAWEETVNRLLIEQELRDRDIRVTDEEIRQAARFSPPPELVGNELFLTDGQFDLSKYQQFLASPAANEDLLLQLEAYYRDVIPRAKLMRQITSGVWVSDAELWRAWRDRRETATVEYVPLVLSTLVPGDVEVSDAQIRSYYEEHPEEFERAASARLTLAYLPKAPTAADTAAALEKARAVRAELLEGADFAEVARRESADPGSRDAGGELGRFGRGQMVPAFEEAAFSVPEGEISEPVLTPFGYHLIQVEERTGDEVEARHILIPAERSEEELENLYARADSLEELAEDAGLQRAARATGATLRESVTVSEDAPFVPGIGSALEAVEWAVEEQDTGTVTPVFETEQAFYVARIDAVTPAGRVPLAEATPQIRRRLVIENKRDKAREIGEEIVAEVRGGTPLREAAAARGLEVATTEPFTRLSFNPALGQANEATGAAFGVPVGAVSDVVETPAGLFIIRPTARTDADRAEWEAQKEEQRANETLRLRQQLAERWLESLRREADIQDLRDQALTQTT